MRKSVLISSGPPAEQDHAGEPTTVTETAGVGTTTATETAGVGTDTAGVTTGTGDTTFSAPLDSFCKAQIQIPMDLPHILKQFTKAAIRTQPRDLDIWGAAYFRAMADGLPPPVKDNLEYPVMESKDGLTVGLLRVLDRQLKDSTITVENARGKWCSLCLEVKAFNELIEIGHFTEADTYDWKKILAVLCTSLGTNLTDTMRVICQVLTEQKEGGDPVIPYVVWWELYLFLARLDGTIPSRQLQQVDEFLVRRAHAKFCLIGPSDFLHVDCPPLY